jgi:hypothetical protein
MQTQLPDRQFEQVSPWQLDSSHLVSQLQEISFVVEKDVEKSLSLHIAQDPTKHTQPYIPQCTQYQLHQELLRSGTRVQSQ